MKYQHTDVWPTDDKGDRALLNDCAVVAVMAALGIPYSESKRILRATEQGVCDARIHISLRARGWVYKKAKTLWDVPKQGTFIVDFQGKKHGHLACVKDGVAHDWNDPVYICKLFKMKCVGYWRQKMNVKDTCAKHNPFTQPEQHKESKLLTPALNHMKDHQGHGDPKCNLSTPCSKARKLLQAWKQSLHKPFDVKKKPVAEETSVSLEPESSVEYAPELKSVSG